MFRSLSFTVFTFMVAIVLELQNCEAQHWSYAHQNEWSHDYPICGSETQSPIDFNKGSIIWNQTIPPFQFYDYDAVLNFTEFNLTNNGHSVQMNIGDTRSGSTRGTPFIVSGGGLPSNYTLAQFHFHWGKANSEGSEHTIDSAFYPMELHLVHWDSVNIGSFKEAANRTEGLAVLGIFVQIGNTDNPIFENLLRYFTPIARNGGTAFDIPQFPLNALLPSNTRDFYRYRGSLTTPPCFNSVVWTVFIQPISISQAQLNQFRTRIFEEKENDSGQTALVNNYRVVQPVNRRRVYKTFDTVEWSYKGTVGSDQWGDYFPRCNGDAQSPIDIPTASVAKKDSFPQFVFTNYNKSAPAGTTFTLTNTGKSVDLVVAGDKLRISGGGLSGEYVLAKISLRWGTNNGQGSDHKVNGLAYPLEMQFVHFSSKYPNFDEASKHPAGLAILAVFYQASPDDNIFLSPIISNLTKIRYPGTSVSLKLFSLSDLIPSDFMSFYQYSGSLTVPNCVQSVVWTIFVDPLKVSAAQMEILRSSVYITNESQEFLADNFRPTQAVNQRSVTRSTTKTIVPTSSAAIQRPSLSSAFVALGMLFVVVVSRQILHHFYKRT